VQRRQSLRWRLCGVAETTPKSEPGLVHAQLLGVVGGQIQRSRRRLDRVHFGWLFQGLLVNCEQCTRPGPSAALLPRLARRFPVARPWTVSLFPSLMRQLLAETTEMPKIWRYVPRSTGPTVSRAAPAVSVSESLHWRFPCDSARLRSFNGKASFWLR
jgi:hypothetical protein